jgi:tetratricopeptide (TPR) repeat protein
MRQFLRDDVAHVQHAWQLALQRRALPTLLSLAESLWFLNGGVVVNSGYLEDFVQAERLLGDDLSVAPALRALLLAGVAQAACRDGHFDLAMQRSRQAQHLAQQARHRDALIYASDNLIQVYVRQRKLRQAEALVRKTAALHYQPDGEACFPPNGLNQQRQLCFLRFDFEAYLRLSDEMIDICRRFEDSEDETRVLLSKATIYADAGNLPLAIQALDQTLAVAAANGASPALQVSALGLSVRWQLELGHIEPARSCIARANAIAFSAALPQWARLFTGLAKAEFAIATGDTTAAAPPLTEALAALSRSELLSLAPEVFLVTARWFLLLKERVACVAMLQAINPEVWEMRTFAAAQKMLRELGEEPRPTSGVAPDEPEAALSAAATIAGRRVLELQLRTQSGHSAVSLLAARAL